MKQLKIIPSDYICQLWDQLEHYFERASITGTNDYTVDQIKYLLVQGKQTLFVIMDMDKIIGAFSVEFTNYPDNKVMHIAANLGTEPRWHMVIDISDKEIYEYKGNKRIKNNRINFFASF